MSVYSTDGSMSDDDQQYFTDDSTSDVEIDEDLAGFIQRRGENLRRAILLYYGYTYDFISGQIARG